MTHLEIRSCGPMTSLQDRGRTGVGRNGISRSGAMDRWALAEANALAGNAPGEGAVELMLLGATLRVHGGPLRMGLAGAAMAVAVDGEPVAPRASFTVGDGGTVVVGTASAGIFGYLAISGGLAVAPVLGSVSLQARAGIGGLEGRALRAGDAVPVRIAAAPDGPETMLPPGRPDDGHAPIRVVLGPQDDFFPPEAVAAFLAHPYAVSTEADRMGYRLSGPPIAHLRGFNIVSDGIVAGSVQVPGSGVPIVMMADHQTTGGYPKIATVISADLGRLAQRRAGEPVRFEALDVAAAQAVARERAAEVAALPGRLVPARSGLPGVEELLGLNLAGAATDALAGCDG